MIVFRTALLSTVLLLCFSVTTNAVRAQDTSSCPDNLAGAENAYFNGDFEQVIEILQPCVDANAFDQSDAQRAIILLGRTHFVLGNEQEAHATIESLFALNPAYVPDPQIPPNFAAFIGEVKEELMAAGEEAPDPEIEQIEDPVSPIDTDPIAMNEEEEAQPRARKKRKNLLLFGGGAAIAVAGVTAALLTGGSSDNPPPDTGLPFPPGRP